MKFISTNLKISNRNNCSHTKVLVGFIVTKEGKIKDPQIMSSPCPEVDRQVIQLINSFPNWTPGVIKRKAVNVYVTIPVSLE